MKEVLYIILDQFAEHEIPYLSEGIVCDCQGMPRSTPKYINKFVAPSMEVVSSLGGLRILPDYSFDAILSRHESFANVAALVLIGGFGWQNKEAELVASLVDKALEHGIFVGAICNAASWMAQHGYLNNIKHTGNGIYALQQWGGEHYSNPQGYVNQQSVTDHNIVTANGSAHLEFACQILQLLDNDTPENIAGYQMYYKMGLVELTNLSK